VSDSRGLQLYEERGLDADHPYFNAGVLLINLEFWRERDIARQVFKYLRWHEDEVLFWDQDGLNYILANDWKALDRQWNVPPKVMNYDTWGDTPFKRSLGDDVGRMQEDPYIVHYIGEDKPWMYGVEVPWQERYFHYLRESGWFSGEWEWKTWRVEQAMEHYRHRLSAKSRWLYSETKRSLVPLARLLGVARSSRG
jgi:lipopolysaccharide biosynthesis glycosyltransferase